VLFNAPPGKVNQVQELYQKLEALNQAIDTATERWLELAELEA
jgi:ATP-binding cassette subfamily F protein uup